jgi:hypothetical protein
MTTSTNNLNLAVVGNCNIAALIDPRGSVVWCCVPRFDSDPVFCSLLNNSDGEKGFWDIELFDFARSEQRYHIRYVMPDLTLRITTDGPVTYLLEEVPFVLDRPVTMLMGADESLTQPVAETGRAFHEKTDEYWREWCRYLSLPFEWQEAVIRAAIGRWKNI